MTDTSAAKIIEIDHRADGVSCNGGDVVLGHPKVWYSFEGAKTIECKYCNRRFAKSA